jgi:hypothetical protein
VSEYVDFIQDHQDARTQHHRRARHAPIFEPSRKFVRGCQPRTAEAGIGLGLDGSRPETFSVGWGTLTEAQEGPNDTQVKRGDLRGPVWSFCLRRSRLVFLFQIRCTGQRQPL